MTRPTPETPFLVPITRQEAGALTRVIAYGNMHDSTAKADAMAATWVAERLTRLLGAASPTPPRRELFSPDVMDFVNSVLPTLEGYGPDGELIDPED